MQKHVTVLYMNRQICDCIPALRYDYEFIRRRKTIGLISYDELKMLAQDRSRWCQWRWKPAKMDRILQQQQQYTSYGLATDHSLPTIYSVFKSVQN